jgi:hypothetical protein
VGLGLGVEGPTSLRELGLYVPAPFMFKCPAWAKGDEADAAQLPRGTLNVKPCEGRMAHVDWADDDHFTTPQLLDDDVPRFLLPDSGGGCARLHMPEGALVRARQSGAQA